MERYKTCCFSGHRRICDEHFMRLPELLTRLLDTLVEKGFRHFKAGGAIGFDTLVALKCLELKKKYPDLGITLELCLPCKDQTRGWSELCVRTYNYCLERADKVTYISEKYYSGCMLERDRRLVDGADVCIAYCTKSHGGTYYTCSYAQKSGVEVVNIAKKL